MRLIWKTTNSDEFTRFTALLKQKNIQFMQETAVNKDWGSPNYGASEQVLWIIDEDKAIECSELLTTFLHNPHDPQFQIEQKPHFTPVSAPPQAPGKPIPIFSQALSLILLTLCSLFFFADMIGEKALDTAPDAAKTVIFTSSPVRKALLYDYPHSSELLDKIVVLYGYNALVKPEVLPPAGQFLFTEYKKEPIFRGYYPYLVILAHNTLSNEKVPYPEDAKLFEKEQKGEIWRFFSPIFLHGSILHLFFNMMWLLILCPQMEIKMGSWKLLFFILTVAFLSNTGQYLMTGPYFLGFSGIICGQVFFIRERQQTAPWEGYLMSSSTFAFICFFIGIVALFSLVANIPIANTAHIIGATAGHFLGKCNFFREK